MQKQPPEVFYEKRPACNFIKKETLAQVFSCEFCEISKNAFFTEHLWTTPCRNEVERHTLNYSGRSSNSGNYLFGRSSNSGNYLSSALLLSCRRFSFDLSYTVFSILRFWKLLENKKDKKAFEWVDKIKINQNAKTKLK